MAKAKRVTTTYNAPYTDAEICRRNGWKAGAVLVADDGHKIKLTAIGRDCVLAVDVLPRGREGYEGEWSLTCRNWTKVKDLKAANI